jgi:GntR family transcriptional regulator
MEAHRSIAPDVRRRAGSAAVERAILFAVFDGRLQPGDRLPTVRELAVRLRASASVVADAYATLEASGLLAPAPDGGSVVAWGEPDGSL